MFVERVRRESLFPDVTMLGVQTVARRLRAGRVGFEARRTMANQSGPYDAVVIGGGVFIHSDTWIRKRGLTLAIGPQVPADTLQRSKLPSLV